MGRHSNFERGWFATEVVHSVPPPSLAPPPPAPEPVGLIGSSLRYGAISGAAGGVIMLLTVQLALSLPRSSIDAVRLLGGVSAELGITVGDPRLHGLVLATAAGAMLGAALGFVTRRLLRVLPRVLFFSLLMPMLWLFVQTAVLGRFAPTLTLPFGPFAVGSLIYAVCLAIAVPTRS
jgi:hypothetical protein